MRDSRTAEPADRTCLTLFEYPVPMNSWERDCCRLQGLSARALCSPAKERRQPDVFRVVRGAHAQPGGPGEASGGAVAGAWAGQFAGDGRDVRWSAMDCDGLRGIAKGVVAL